jgi:monoamine oxidase
LPVPVELGAEFIHGRSEATFALLAKAATAAVDTSGQRWTVRGGKLERARDLFSEIARAMERTQALEQLDLPFATFLVRHLDRFLSPEARRFARTLAEGFDAADLKRVSARSIVEEWSGGTSLRAGQFRPLGGYGALMSSLATELRGSSVALQLNTIVRRVRWKRGSVEVEGSFLGQSFAAAASKAIITLPLGVLQLKAGANGAVSFTPALRQKRKALGLLAAGPALKVMLRFKSAFWEKAARGRYCNAGFFHAPEAEFPTFWTALPVRTPLLVAWAGGPKAKRLSNMTSDRVIGAALQSLGSIFGQTPNLERKLEGAWVHDWQSDPFSRGAYSYVCAGGDRARQTLAEPVLDTLFFAGEAADTEGQAGTVAGALQSGTRAAREVLGS